MGQSLPAAQPPIRRIFIPSHLGFLFPLCLLPLSDQRIRKAPLDLHVHESARTQRGLPRNVHDAIAAGAAGADAPLPVETLDEHFERAPLHLAVQLPLDLLLNRHEACEAKGRLSWRDVVLPPERGGLRARRIREREDSGEPHLLSLIHISEPTRLGMISYAVFCLKK